jgi:hypothetical protein
MLEILNFFHEIFLAHKFLIVCIDYKRKLIIVFNF